MKKIISNIFILTICLIVTVVSCKKGAVSPAPATADFSFAASGLSVAFSNLSTNSRYFSWNFGDGSATSASMSPSHAYDDGGTYTVTLTITGRDGSTKTVTHSVTVVAPPNLVQGGKMNAGDASYWSNITFSPGVTFAIENGKMVARGGNWGHAGIYQKISVVAGKTYVLDMTISGGGAQDTWFEVYVDPTVPVQGMSDYSYGGKRMGFSTWCYGNNQAFDGLLSSTNISCADALGKNVLTFSQTGDVYLVIRAGGSSLGSTGISIDNVSLIEKK